MTVGKDYSIRITFFYQSKFHILSGYLLKYSINRVTTLNNKADLLYTVFHIVPLAMPTQHSLLYRCLRITVPVRDKLHKSECLNTNPLDLTYIQFTFSKIGKVAY